jgi:hypothetical protein
MIRMALAVFAIGTVSVWMAAVAAWGLATFAAQVIEAALEDDTDYTDPESDTP